MDEVKDVLTIVPTSASTIAKSALDLARWEETIQKNAKDLALREAKLLKGEKDLRDNEERFRERVRREREDEQRRQRRTREEDDARNRRRRRRTRSRSPVVRFNDRNDRPARASQQPETRQAADIRMVREAQIFPYQQQQQQQSQQQLPPQLLRQQYQQYGPPIQDQDGGRYFTTSNYPQAATMQFLSQFQNPVVFHGSAPSPARQQVGGNIHPDRQSHWGNSVITTPQYAQAPRSPSYAPTSPVTAPITHSATSPPYSPSDAPV